MTKKNSSISFESILFGISVINTGAPETVYVHPQHSYICARVMGYLQNTKIAVNRLEKNIYLGLLR